ncbi:hypothetical protein [Sphingomonas nostoxanthinifaciens]|uniref:hypothetical protein n=1 Tax=Sphingomonas nostoxanthinifaciens TaxID=2872652 RepID=UPI001CC20698|nr:hypothetical protein [Sphingomonas nostoxanthinifaciens]UAK24342.1 hypothetical protein K8P63_18850 [Sphingomonas nostoxanthinifaciens]
MANAWLLQPLPIVDVTTSGTLQMGTGLNVANDYAGVICQLAMDGSGNGAYFRIDLGADTAFDTITAFGVELAPPSTAVYVSYATAAQGPFTGDYTSVPTGVNAYAGSAPMSSGKGVTIWSLNAPVVARYVLISYGAGNSSASVRISRLVIGQRIQLERNFTFGGTFGVKDLGSVDFSRRGVLLRQRGKKLRTTAITFSNQRKDEVEAKTKPLIEQLGNTEMLAIVTDPTPDAQRQNRCYFGPLVGDLNHTWRNAAAWEWKVNLVSLF